MADHIDKLLREELRKSGLSSILEEKWKCKDCDKTFDEEPTDDECTECGGKVEKEKEKEESHLHEGMSAVMSALSAYDPDLSSNDQGFSGNDAVYASSSGVAVAVVEGNGDIPEAHGEFQVFATTDDWASTNFKVGLTEGEAIATALQVLGGDTDFSGWF